MNDYCEKSSQESGTIGGRKEKEFVEDSLPTGNYLTI